MESRAHSTSDFTCVGEVFEYLQRNNKMAIKLNEFSNGLHANPRAQKGFLRFWFLSEEHRRAEC